MSGTDNGLSLKGVQLTSWILLTVMTGFTLLYFDMFIGRSVFIGGLLVNLSFWMLQKDLTKLLKGPLDGVKARFFLKYYLRFLILAFVLFLLISKGLVHLVGLLIGLSTVLFSITALAVVVARKSINIREAS